MLPIESNTNETMVDIGHDIEKYIGTDRKYGFMVMIFEFEKGKTAHYISNADRGTMIKALREKADVLEQKLDVPVVDDEQVN